MEIINCTPHDVVVRKFNLVSFKEVTILKSGIIPRVSTVESEAEDILGFKAVTQSTGDVEGLPEPKEGVFYLVSGMVFSATDRLDVIAPDTGKTAIRNEAGQIIAVTRFLRR